MHMPTEDRWTEAPADAPLAAALLLFGAILVFISSCGGQGLTPPSYSFKRARRMQRRRQKDPPARSRATT